MIYTEDMPMRSAVLAPVLSALLALVVGACGQEPAAPESAKSEAPKPPSEIVVKIGQVSPLTGPQAHLGKDNDNGARLAIEEANAKGLVIGGAKVRFELLSEDDQADPKTGTIVAQKLVDGKVAGRSEEHTSELQSQ